MLKYPVTKEEIDTIEMDELNDMTIGDIYLNNEDGDDGFVVCTGWGSFYYALCPLLEKRYMSIDLYVFFNGVRIDDIDISDFDCPKNIKKRAEDWGATLITVIGRRTVIEFTL